MPDLVNTLAAKLLGFKTMAIVDRHRMPECVITVSVPALETNIKALAILRTNLALTAQAKLNPDTDRKGLPLTVQAELTPDTNLKSLPPMDQAELTYRVTRAHRRALAWARVLFYPFSTRIKAA